MCSGWEWLIGGMDLDGDGGFRVQRLLFEHSMQVPLLLAATLSADSVDPRQFLKVGTDGKRRVAGATKVPYILRSEFHQITETWQPKLNWENALMAALCTNMPYAILAVNPDLEKYVLRSTRRNTASGNCPLFPCIC